MTNVYNALGFQSKFGMTIILVACHPEFISGSSTSKWIASLMLAMTYSITQPVLLRLFSPMLHGLLVKAEYSTHASA